ncbi:MAG: hypothetical protein LWW93_06810 [Hyphomicrobiales bacterium]|nr:hypothetical protein [Hyphomicrobiales bacterium]
MTCVPNGMTAEALRISLDEVRASPASARMPPTDETSGRGRSPEDA